MADPISVCLNDLRSAADVAAVESALERFFSTWAINFYVFHDPCKPLDENCPGRGLDPALTSSLERQPVWQIDPLRLRSRGDPLIWDAERECCPASADAERLVWAPVSQAGYRQAVIVPIYGPTGHCNVLSVFMRDRPVPQPDRLVNDLIVLAYDLSRFFRNRATTHHHSNLTHRESDCLGWTAAGKTAWEIGQILKISERTAHFHLQNAMRKLDARTKYQAVMAAMRLGIISEQLSEDCP